MTKRYYHVNDGVVNFPNGYGAEPGQTVTLDENVPLVGEVYGYDATRQTIFEATQALVESGQISDYGVLVNVDRNTAVYLLDVDTSTLVDGDLAVVVPGIVGAVSAVSYTVLDGGGAVATLAVEVRPVGSAAVPVAEVALAGAEDPGSVVPGDTIVGPVALAADASLAVSVDDAADDAGHGILTVTISI